MREFRDLNIVELSNQVDACELEMKVTMEALIKKYGERQQPGKLENRR